MRNVGVQRRSLFHITALHKHFVSTHFWGDHPALLRRSLLPEHCVQSFELLRWTLWLPRLRRRYRVTLYLHTRFPIIRETEPVLSPRKARRAQGHLKEESPG